LIGSIIKGANPRLAKLIDVYGEQDGYRVYNKIIAIGMTKSMAQSDIRVIAKFQ